MSNAMRCIDHKFVLKNSGIFCLALTLMLNLSNPKMTILQAKKLFQAER